MTDPVRTAVETFLRQWDSGESDEYAMVERLRAALRPSPDSEGPTLTPDGYDQRSWEAGWNAALEDTPDRADLPLTRYSQGYDTMDEDPEGAWVGYDDVQAMRATPNRAEPPDNEPDRRYALQMALTEPCTCRPFFSGHVVAHPDCPRGRAEAAALRPSPGLATPDRADRLSTPRTETSDRIENGWSEYDAPPPGDSDR